MTGGKKIVLLASTFLMTGCVTDQNYQVRAIPDPAAKFRYAGSLIAQGRAQLALGNVGLALETFRKAEREQSPSADTFAGIAACYAAMGRYDIARANYEFALAYAPGDRNLLTALANSLDQLGENSQAIQVRAEALRLAAAPAPATGQAQAAQAKQAAVTPLDVPRLSSITVALPPPVSKKSERSTQRATIVAQKKTAPVPAALQAQAPKAKQAALAPIDAQRGSSIAAALPSPISKRPEHSAPRTRELVMKQEALSFGAPQAQAPVIKMSSNPLPPKKVELAASLETWMPSPARPAQDGGSQASAQKANGSSGQIVGSSDLPAKPTPKAALSVALLKPAPNEVVASRPAAAGKAAPVPLTARTALLKNAIVSSDPLRPKDRAPKVAVPAEIREPAPIRLVAGQPAATLKVTAAALPLRPPPSGQTVVSPAPLRLAIAGSKTPISIEPRNPIPSVTVASRPVASLRAVAAPLAPRPPVSEKAGVKPAMVAEGPAPSAGPLEMAARSKPQSPPVPANRQRPAMPAYRPPEALIARAEPGIESGPHLERLSLREVALVTEPVAARAARTKPRHPEAPLPAPTDIAMNVSRAEKAPHLASADAVSWVPLKYAPLQAPVQLLNAARTQSLAARTRVTLLDRGWHKVRIGNALKVRRHSLILYASARWGVARRLAAYFGCRAVKSDKVHNVVVLLGRDAAMLRKGSERA